MRVEIKGECHEFNKGTTLEEVFKALGYDLSKIVAAKVDGKVMGPIESSRDRALAEPARLPD